MRLMAPIIAFQQSSFHVGTIVERFIALYS